MGRIPNQKEVWWVRTQLLIFLFQDSETRNLFLSIYKKEDVVALACWFGWITRNKFFDWNKLMEITRTSASSIVMKKTYQWPLTSGEANLIGKGKRRKASLWGQGCKRHKGIGRNCPFKVCALFRPKNKKRRVPYNLYLSFSSII